MPDPRTPEFEAILDETAQEYAETDILNTWMPEEDARYTCHLEGYKEGSRIKGEARYIWATVESVIHAPHDPAINKRVFVLRYRSDRGQFRLKGDVAILNGGEKVDSNRRSLEILREAAEGGTLVEIDVTTSSPNQKGQTFRNASIASVIPTEATNVADAPPAPETAEAVPA